MLAGGQDQRGQQLAVGELARAVESDAVGMRRALPVLFRACALMLDKSRGSPEAATVSFRSSRESFHWRDGARVPNATPVIGFRLCRLGPAP